MKMARNHQGELSEKRMILPGDIGLQYSMHLCVKPSRGLDDHTHIVMPLPFLSGSSAQDATAQSTWTLICYLSTSDKVPYLVSPRSPLREDLHFKDHFVDVVANQ